MKNWSKRQSKIFKIGAGVVIGGLLGYAYYYFIGCSSGSCPITSNPYASIFYGSVIGLVWTVK